MTATIRGSIRLSKAHGGDVALVGDHLFHSLDQTWIGVVFKRTSGAPTTWADIADYTAQVPFEYPEGKFSTHGDGTQRLEVKGHQLASSYASAATDDYMYLVIVASGTPVPDPSTTFDAITPAGRLKA